MQASDLTNETEVNLPCQPPQLQYQTLDQTVGKQDSKRMRSELSPISELNNMDTCRSRKKPTKTLLPFIRPID